jgi:hypothetical protein
MSKKVIGIDLASGKDYTSMVVMGGGKVLQLHQGTTMDVEQIRAAVRTLETANQMSVNANNVLKFAVWFKSQLFREMGGTGI